MDVLRPALDFLTVSGCAKVLPISFFERSGNAYYNSIAIIDADGSVLGVYRKTHIPDSPGYMEKFYFTPGDTGFKVRQGPHPPGEALSSLEPTSNRLRLRLRGVGRLLLMGPHGSCGLNGVGLCNNRSRLDENIGLGSQVWDTRYARIGVAICWDQVRQVQSIFDEGDP
jgi:predicted amidohydrolase